MLNGASAPATRSTLSRRSPRIEATTPQKSQRQPSTVHCAGRSIYLGEKISYIKPHYGIFIGIEAVQIAIFDIDANTSDITARERKSGPRGAIPAKEVNVGGAVVAIALERKEVIKGNTSAKHRFIGLQP